MNPDAKRDPSPSAGAHQAAGDASTPPAPGVETPAVSSELEQLIEAHRRAFGLLRLGEFTSDAEGDVASAADDAAIDALCDYRPQTIEEARLWASCIAGYVAHMDICEPAARAMRALGGAHAAISNGVKLWLTSTRQPAAAPVPEREDPIFNLIERHKTALAARAAAEAAGDDAAYEAAYDQEATLHHLLFATRPTSLAGAAGFASHVSAMPGLVEQDGEHYSAVRAMSTLAVALSNIVVENRTGRSAWSSHRRMRDSTPVAPREDRVFGLIKRHKAALAARRAAEAAGDDAAYEAAYDQEATLHRLLFATRPTSLAGAAEFASHIAAMPGLVEQDGEHYSAVRAMSTLAVALSNIMTEKRTGRPAYTPYRRMRDFDVAAGKCSGFRIGGEE